MAGLTSVRDYAKRSAAGLKTCLHHKGKLMKRSIGTAMLVIALTGFATLAEAQKVSGPLPHYAVTYLGTLGGSGSNGYGGVTNSGWVSGDSYLRAT